MSRANYGSGKFEFVVLNDILPGVPGENAAKKWAGLQDGRARAVALSRWFVKLQVSDYKHVQTPDPLPFMVVGPKKLTKQTQ
jgi:hypothetical protein